LLLEKYEEAAVQYMIAYDFVKAIECYDILNQWDKILDLLSKNENKFEK
jgi:hypothetical protein